MWLVLFIVLTLSSVANGTLDIYVTLNDPSRVWDCRSIIPGGFGIRRCSLKFNDLTVTLQLFDGTTELNDAPTVRISLLSFEISPHIAKIDRILDGA